MIAIIALNTDATRDLGVLAAPAPTDYQPGFITRDSRGGSFVLVQQPPAAPPQLRVEPITAAGAADPPGAASEQVTAALTRIAALGRLPYGWDDDGAPSPSPLAVQRASEILALVQTLPDEIDPDAVGGIAMWFYCGDGTHTMIGVRNDGRAAVCSYTSNSPLPEVSMATDAASAAALVRANLRAR